MNYVTMSIEEYVEHEYKGTIKECDEFSPHPTRV